MTKIHVFGKLFLSLFFLMLYACAGSDTDKNITGNKATAELPVGLQKLALGDGGALNAYITVDGDEANRGTMTIDPAGVGSASLVVDGLTRARHEITITYEYTTLTGATYVVASASQTVDLSSGSARLSFASSGYDIDQYDDDEDGSNNAAELKAGTNPNDKTDTPHLVFNSGFAKSVAENTTATGYQAVVAAADDAPVRYTLIGGLDQDKFRIDPTTGILSFTDARDFENPQDSDKNNVYEVIIEAVDTLDSSAVSTQTALITVNDILNDNTEGNRPFITVWKTDNPGVSEDNQVRIGIKGRGYNFNINWGDGKVDENLKENPDSPALATTFTHQYEEPGIYTISINGIFPRIYFETFDPDDTSNPEVQTDYDYDKILSIVQWGDIKWQSMDHAFFRCTNLAGNAIDNPDLSQVTNMNEMFYGASKFNQDISGWDVSGVTIMSAMFFEASSFNQEIGGWDVSSVTTMRKMFDSASAFNGDIGNWDVSAVTDMNRMFNKASVFNRSLNSWDVSKVTNMNRMFDEAIVFNGDISSWNVSAVTDMGSIFHDVRRFNQDISGWDVSKVTNMGGMFTNNEVFNHDISGWNVSNVTSMSGMFRATRAFNQDLSAWDVSSVTSVKDMFNNASAFNQDIGAWRVSLVTDMSNMFKDATLSTANYDALLLGWSVQSLTPNKDLSFSAGNSTYSSSSQPLRDVLTGTFLWNVTDGGVASVISPPIIIPAEIP